MLGTQTSILMISAVDYQHSGVYTCRAENPAGISTYSAELKVNGKLSGKVVVVRVSGGTCIVIIGFCV